MFFPGATFADALDNFISNFYGPDSRSDRERLLEGTNDADLADRLEDIAEALISNASELAGSEIMLYLESLQSLLAMGPSESFGRRFEYLARAVDARVADEIRSVAMSASGRLQSLLALMQRMDLSPATAAFLKRVSRCFLFGFDVECAIMCRSALDAEFQAEIPTDECMRILGRRDRRDGESAYDLHDRIAVAARLGRLDAATVELAHQLRRQTNSLVHRSPHHSLDVQGMLGGTLTVIAGLHNRR